MTTRRVRVSSYSLLTLTLLPHPKLLHIPNRSLYPLVDIIQLHLLIRSMKVVVWEAEADQDRGHAKHCAEQRDDGDGASTAHEHGFPAEDFSQGVGGGFHIRGAGR